LIGSVRIELLDQTLFWTATDLDNKLRDYQSYYNKYQTRSGRDGATPVDSASAIMALTSENSKCPTERPSLTIRQASRWQTLLAGVGIPWRRPSRTISPFR
jgi:hypothetical protein